VANVEGSTEEARRKEKGERIEATTNGKGRGATRSTASRSSVATTSN